MPLNFVEPEAIPEFIHAKSVKTLPLQLESQVMPALLKQIGDVKSGRFSCEKAEAFLRAHYMTYDMEKLKKMYEEADFKKEGSIVAKELIATLSGRYPKRKFTNDWRELAAMVLGLPELCLAEDAVSNQHYVMRRSNQGTFNAESIWDAEPPSLPPITRRTRTKSTIKKAPVTGEWQQISSSSLLASGTIPPDATLLTTGGLKSAAPITAELTINRHMLDASQSRSTFEDVKAYKDFSEGLELTQTLAADGSEHMHASTSTYGQPPQGVKAWKATLPPKAITVPASALSSLRNTVKSTVTTKPAFDPTHRGLTTAENDLKKTLGTQMDVSSSLARVEPVRPTKVLYNANYVQWSDYSSNCRTTPTRWMNEHPAMEAPSEKPKYPWG